MSKYVGSWVVILLASACDSFAPTDDESNGSAGHSAASGKGGSSPSGSAGKGIGGSLDIGGALAVGGSITLVGGFGGADSGGTLDPRCPPLLPSGECEGDVTLSCQYDDYTGCLCYSPPPHYVLCKLADPTCPNDAGGGAPSEADAGGAGGFSTKVVLPPKMVCRCTESTWACDFGY